MRVLVTAGPTREYIDSVRFITNASSGKMGCACAAAAAAAGHEVTLLIGPVHPEPPAGVELVRFVSVDDLRGELESRFDGCNALIMAAAVGDFTPAERRDAKLPRRGGRVKLTLVPTEDILAALGRRRRADQVIVGFCVEDDADRASARKEMAAKNCDYYVVNTLAAMGADASEACILSGDGLAAPPALRTKAELAREIVGLLGGAPADRADEQQPR